MGKLCADILQTHLKKRCFICKKCIKIGRITFF